MSDYEAGRKSPTVATLNRILAGAGLQIRAELEPLRAELEARVDAASADLGPLDEQALGSLAGVVRALQDQAFGWGIDGETALRVHGYGFTSDLVQVAVCFDDAARRYFFRNRVRGTGGDPVSWFDADVRAAQEYLGRMAFGPFGMVGLRLVAEGTGEAPRDASSGALRAGLSTVRIEVGPGLVVPVLTVDEVARGRPDLAEVLERLRARTLAAHVA